METWTPSVVYRARLKRVDGFETKTETGVGDGRLTTPLQEGASTASVYPQSRGRTDSSRTATMFVGRARDSLFVILGFLTNRVHRQAQAFSCSPTTTRTTGGKKAARTFLLGLTHRDANHRNGRAAPDLRRVNLLSTRGIQQDNAGNSSDEKKKEPIRSRLRQITGFSLTAFRATMRAATGISMTAVYASTVAFTGQWIRQSMKVVLSIFPAWARYFVQPILILYYLPLYTLRNLTGPNRRRGFEKPHALVDGWNQAIVTADNESLALWEVDDDDEEM
jgi:hypothetical protein